MQYSEKLIKLRQFASLGINSRRKNFTTQEKRLITTYYNKLDGLGYFDSISVGYQAISIAGKKAPKIKGAPKIKKRMVEVGTIIKNGEVITNPKRKVKIKNGKIYVTQDGAPRIWRFEYDISKEWSEAAFIRHLKKQIGKEGLKKTQFFAVGAGIKYEVSNSAATSLKLVAQNILKIGYRYTSQLTEQYEHKGQKKYLSDWLQEVVVYEYKEDVINRMINKKLIKKASKRKNKRGASHGKNNRRN